MVITTFLVIDKTNQVGFFEETFLETTINLDVVFGILFLFLSGVDVDFLG